MNTILITLLTLNVWGLPDLGFKVLAPLREERLNHICEILKKATYDVVLLQEVWIESDRERFHHCGYAFAIDLNTTDRPLDSGLMILSKISPEKTEKIYYPALPPNLIHQEDGEYLARKGAVAIEIKLAGIPVWIGNTHLISQYTKEENDPYRALRGQQFSRFRRWTKDLAQNKPFLIGGDFNFTLQSRLANDLKNELALFVQPLGAELACTLCPPNTYHATNEGRVDHLLGSHHWRAIKGGVALAEILSLEGVKTSLSDHLGWVTQFELIP